MSTTCYLVDLQQGMPLFGPPSEILGKLIDHSGSALLAATFLVGPSYVIGQYIIAGDAVHSGQLLATQARDNTKVENTKTAQK